MDLPTLLAEVKKHLTEGRMIASENALLFFIRIMPDVKDVQSRTLLLNCLNTIVDQHLLQL